MAIVVPLLLWIGLLLQALWLAPPTRPDLWDWIWRISVGDWFGEDPSVIALFNMMGLWPTLFLVRLRRELLAGPVPALPFVVVSFFLGGFALLPYLIVRPLLKDRRQGEVGERFGDLLAAPVASGVLLVAAGGLGAWAFVRGDVTVLLSMIRTDGFVSTMSLDFVCLWLAYGLLALEKTDRPWAVTALPLIGACIWGAVDALAEEADASVDAA